MEKIKRKRSRKEKNVATTNHDHRKRNYQNVSFNSRNCSLPSPNSKKPGARVNCSSFRHWSLEDVAGWGYQMSLLYSTQRASLANAVSPVDRNDLIRACALAVAPEFNFPAALMDQNVADRGYTEPGSFRPRNRCLDRVSRVDR